MITFYEIVDNGEGVVRLEDQSSGAEKIQSDDKIFCIGTDGLPVYYFAEEEYGTLVTLSDVLLQYRVRHLPKNPIIPSHIHNSIDRMDEELKNKGWSTASNMISRKELFLLEKIYKERGFYTRIADNWDDSTKLVLWVYK